MKHSQYTSVSSLEKGLLTGDGSELGSLLQAALEKEDLESLLQAIIKAQSEGIMADVLDLARCKASHLQSRISRLATAAAF
eukprot:symbB.v1.2.029513.t1/scaffold3239.1/size60467/4